MPGFPFTDAERAGLAPDRAIEVDTAGREVLTGLTLEETERLMAHRRRFLQGVRERDRGVKLQMNALREKHALARLKALGSSIANDSL